MANLSVNTMKSYISAGLNLLIAGQHGVGKTAKLQEAASQLGLTMKYYSSSTLDAFSDLVGIPVPQMETETIKYFRPKEIDEAEIVFFDELNRADPKTLNTLFEIIQFKTINGEPLPKLKVVVAAINPVSDEYTTDELDAALKDRFDVFLDAKPEIDLGYFTSRYGASVAKAAVSFWNGYHSAHTASLRSNRGNAMPYLSPRRMDKITGGFVAIPNRQTIVDMLPPEVTDSSVAASIYRALNDAVNGVKNAPKLPGVDSAAVSDFISLSIADQRNAAGAKAVKAILSDPKLSDSDRARVLNSLSASLSSQKGPDTIANQFGEAVALMTDAQKKSMTSTWPSHKVYALKDAMRSRGFVYYTHSF